MVVRISLTQDYAALLDDGDADLTGKKWHVAKRGPHLCYAACIRRDGRGKTRKTRKTRTIFLHRVILERVLGRPLALGEMTDHVNGDTLDNRRCNLRVATASGNARNSRKPENNTSGYKGVSWSKADKAWQASIGVNGERICLGNYDDPVEAAKAYDQAAIRYHGEFARLNFSNQGDRCDKEVIRYPIPRNNTSGYRGVVWEIRTRKWRAIIRANGKQIPLGYYKDPIEAAKTYDQAAVRYHGKLAKLNFPI